MYRLFVLQKILMRHSQFLFLEILKTESKLKLKNFRYIPKVPIIKFYFKFLTRYLKHKYCGNLLDRLEQRQLLHKILAMQTYFKYTAKIIEEPEVKLMQTYLS